MVWIVYSDKLIQRPGAPLISSRAVVGTWVLARARFIFQIAVLESVVGMLHQAEKNVCFVSMIGDYDQSHLARCSGDGTFENVRRRNPGNNVAFPHELSWEV